jgi:26S proteasome regulatory subunit N2
VTSYLLEALRSSSNEVVQHGACLGLGLAALGTGAPRPAPPPGGLPRPACCARSCLLPPRPAPRAPPAPSCQAGSEEAAEELKNVLYTDSAVAGEAAGLGLGLLLAGTASEKAAELLAYAHDTQHEKIIRCARL